MIALRDYQVEAIKCIERDFAAGPESSRVVAALPTGTGKTVLFASLARHFAVEHGRRVLIIVHRKELIDQAVDKLQKLIPAESGVTIGVVKAARNEVDAHVVVASVQTISQDTRIEDIKPDFGFMVADECHHAVANTWMKVMQHARVFEPDGPKLLGCTATPHRYDDVGLDNAFQKISFHRTILEMIEAGWLCDVRAVEARLPGVDFAQLRQSRGDYTPGSASALLMQANAPVSITKAYQKFGEDRKTLAFVPTVVMAEAVTLAFNEAGIKAECVHGETEEDVERPAILARCKSGETRIVVNVGVLTEGYDEPSIECVLLARPTKSNLLYTQMIGRGTRLSPETGKTDLLILDCIGVTNHRQLITAKTLDGLELKDTSGKVSVVKQIEWQRRDEEIRAEARRIAKAAEEQRLEAVKRDILRREQARAATAEIRRQERYIYNASRWAKWPEAGRDFYTVSLGEAGHLAIYKDVKRAGYSLIHRHPDEKYTVIVRDTSFDRCVNKAEDVLAEYPEAERLYDPDAMWREKEPSRPMLGRARYKKVPANLITPDTTAGEVSNLITLYTEKDMHSRDDRPGRDLDGQEEGGKR